MEVIKDEQLWKIAKKRAGFKKHLAVYLIINAFLWAIWYITDDHNPYNLGAERLKYAWPIWTTLGWGVGLAFNYVSAYHHMDKDDSVQREYDKLRNQRK